MLDGRGDIVCDDVTNTQIAAGADVCDDRVVSAALIDFQFPCSTITFE